MLINSAVYEDGRIVLAGIWGMNFETMPDLKWARGYPMAPGVVVRVSGALCWRCKRLQWL